MKKLLPILFLLLPSLALAGMPDPADIAMYSRHNEKTAVAHILADRTEGDSILAALREYDSYEPFPMQQLLTRGKGCIRFPAPGYELLLMPQEKDGGIYIVKFQPGTDAETGAPVWAVSLEHFSMDVHGNDPIRLVPSDVAAILQAHFDAWDAADNCPFDSPSADTPSPDSAP